MHWGTALFVGVVLLFTAAFWLMLLVGVVHGIVPAVPALGYWTSFLLAFLYGAFHNAATWPSNQNTDNL